MKYDLKKWKHLDIFSINQYLRLVKDYSPYILDIRSLQEYCQGHLCGSHHIKTPLPPVQKTDIEDLNNQLKQICTRGPDSLIIVYCKVGKRAGLAKNLLNKLGYKNVLSLGGVDESPLKEVIDGSNKNVLVCRCLK